jgi:hypothetical protein
MEGMRKKLQTVSAARMPKMREAIASPDRRATPLALAVGPAGVGAAAAAAPNAPPALAPGE